MRQASRQMSGGVRARMCAAGLTRGERPRLLRCPSLRASSDLPPPPVAAAQTLTRHPHSPARNTAPDSRRTLLLRQLHAGLLPSPTLDASLSSLTAAVAAAAAASAAATMSQMELGASGEDVDLWLDTELFLDVRLPSGEWVEGETVDVRGRFILVRFLTRPDLQPEWINVDSDTNRLAELHTRAGGSDAAQNEAAEVARETAQGEGIEGGAQAAAQSEEQLALARELFVEVLSRARRDLQQLLDDSGDGWLEAAAQRRMQPDSSGAPPASSSAAAAAAASSSSALQLAKSQSCIVPPASVPGNGSLSAAEADADSDGLFSVRSVRLTLPLFDSHTHSRLLVPVRSPLCAHPDCFDLWTHIQTRMELAEREPVWTCPLCKKEAWAAELRVDPLLMHTLRVIEDGRLEAAGKEAAPASSAAAAAAAVAAPAHLPSPSSALSFTPSFPLFSAASFAATLRALDDLASHPPDWGHAQQPFEERRLSLRMDAMGTGAAGGGVASLRLGLSSESEETAIREAKRAARRARSMPLSARSANASGVQLLSPDPSPEDAMASPFKKQRLEESPAAAALSADADQPSSPTQPLQLDMDLSSDFADAHSSSAALSSAPPAASSSSSALAACSLELPWPSWLDARGRFWVDLREGPGDVEEAGTWDRVRVKMEQQHAAYEEMQRKREEMFRPPPPPLPLPPQLPPMALAMPGGFHAFLSGLDPAQQGAMMAQLAGLAPQPAAASFAPPFNRAATIPASSAATAAAAAATAASSPNATPKRKTRSRKKSLARSHSSAAATAASSSPARSRALSPSPDSGDEQSASAAASAAPAGFSTPLIDLNRCSVYDLMQIEGVGPKLAQRIIDTRMERWMNKKVEFNDAIAEERKEAREASAEGGAAVAAASAECECESPRDCRHVRAFSTVKGVRKVEGVGPKLFARLKHCLSV